MTEAHSAVRDVSSWTSEITAKDIALRGLETQQPRALDGPLDGNHDHGHNHDDQDDDDHADDEAREIAEAREELSRLETQTMITADSVSGGENCNGGEREMLNGCDRISTQPPKPPRAAGYDAWERYDADAEIRLLEKRENAEGALRQRLSHLENRSAQQRVRKQSARAELEAASLHAEGNCAFGEARYTDAALAYTSALETITQSRGAESHSAALYANRALALLKLLRPAEAEEDCCAALSIVPTHAKALLRRAEARIQLRQYVEAVDDLGLVLELEPKNSEARRQLYLARQLQESGGVGKGAAPSRAVRVQNVAHDQDNDDDPFLMLLGEVKAAVDI